MKRILGMMVMLGVTMVGFAGEKDMKGDEPKAEPKSSLAVEKMVFCTGVQDRAPQGEEKTFSGKVGQVYCWMVVTGADSETQVKQTWWHKGELVREIPLTVRYPRFRTWSVKSIPQPAQDTEWTVKVTDANNQVLKEATFTVTGGTGDKEVTPPSHSEHSEKK